MSVDTTTWCAAEAAAKLLTAVQNLIPTAPREGSQPHRTTVRTITRCVSDMLSDAGLCGGPHCKLDCPSVSRDQISEILRTLQVALEDESPTSNALAAEILAELRDRLAVLQDG